MTENQYETALLALGCKNVTTNRQKSNGTTAFKLPTGHIVSEHKTGYIRRNIYKEDKGVGGRCYQLNPTYNVPYQCIAQDGKLYRYEGSKRRTLIWSRKARLKKLFLYAIKKLNNERK
tara:strand:+ start:878 stop:1231 length:354 start_codon:yes stop_codon:yes gene_type:complete